MVSDGSYNTRKSFFEEAGLEFTLVEQNLVDIVWNEKGGKAPRTANPVIVHSQAFTGESVADKVSRVKRTMLGELKAPKEVNALVLSELDDIAWLLNLRGSDIAFNPLFFSYAILYFKSEEEEAKESFSIDLYIDHPDTRFAGEEVRGHLEANPIKIKPYGKIFEDLKEGLGEGVVIGYDAGTMNHALAGLIADRYNDQAKKITAPVKHTKVREECDIVLKDSKGDRRDASSGDP